MKPIVAPPPEIDEPQEEIVKDKKKKKGDTLADVMSVIEKGKKKIVFYEEDGNLIYKLRFLKLNAQLGGGLVGGSIIELFGFEDAAKTSTAIAMSADIQSQAKPGNDMVLLVNWEGPQFWNWWRLLGLKTDKDHFVQLRPRNLEEGVAHTAKLVATGRFCCVIFDSVYAATAKVRSQMLDNWIGESDKGIALGPEAVKWGEAWSSLKLIFQDHNTVAIATNQMRELINVQGGGGRKMRQKPVTTPRGHALKFYAWVRIKLEGRWLDEAVYPGLRGGKLIRMRIIKNKTSDDIPGICEYPITRKGGFDLASEIIELSIITKVIKSKGGGNFYIGDTRVRGKDKLREIVLSTPKILHLLQEKIEAKIKKEGIKCLTVSEDEEDEDE